MAEFVHVTSTTDGVAILLIDNPPWNTLSRQVDDELVDAAASIAADPAIRVAIVHGGPKLFCAGADLAERADLTVEQYDRIGGLERGIEAIAALRIPTIAAITGHAIGTGLHLAAATDHRVAGDNVRFGLPEIRYAAIPSTAALRRLADLIGPSATTDLARAGTPFGAAEALRLGLLDAVVAPDDVLSAALTVAGRYRGRPDLLAAIADAVADRREPSAPQVDPVRALLADPDHGERIRAYLAGGPAAVGTSR
ncbi:enoyl-CoA hydratase-related protein [Millisia brevis]|uniref:enoyl-CoA hydratase-related protein n=1 Tax=Millisia brevis TaxID=264148 RepID=UPI0008299554|nr:enoyl-CoA hydratase-related protein [Millisia brevis]